MFIFRPLLEIYEIKWKFNFFKEMFFFRFLSGPIRPEIKFYINIFLKKLGSLKILSYYYIINLFYWKTYKSLQPIFKFLRKIDQK